MRGSSAKPTAGSPSSRTNAFTIVVVRLQEQFVVQSVLTTSSHTVGERNMRPAPAVTQASSASSSARR